MKKRSWRNKKINKKGWYIVDLRSTTRKGSYFLLPSKYESKAVAKRAIRINFPNEIIMFDPIRGSEAIEFGMRFKMRSKYKITSPLAKRSDKESSRTVKYDYPPEVGAGQSRKSFRTKYRRWKRDHKRELSNIWAAINSE